MDENKVMASEFSKALIGQEWKDAEWCGVNFKVKSYLSLDDVMEFTSFVTSVCFADDTEEYMPELKEFLTRVAIVKACTNIELPEKLDEQYDLVWAPQFISTILENTNKTQVMGLLSAVDEKVKHKAQSNIEALKASVDQIVNEFNKLFEQMSGVYEGLSADDIQKVVGAISDGAFDEKKLIDAFMTEDNSDKQD